MFSFANYVLGNTGVGLSVTDPEQERDPPAQPTPVTFPERRAYNDNAWSGCSEPPKLQPLFSRILKPSDISPIHVEALNVQLNSPCEPDELLPVAPDGSSYLPPLTPDKAINATSYAEAAKADASSTRKRKEFDERLAELRVENDTGFRVITRTTRAGSKPPRLAYMRKFWEGLESVAQYWDTSMDQYYEGLPAKSDSDDREKEAKRQRLDSTQSGAPSILTLQTASAKRPVTPEATATSPKSKTETSRQSTDETSPAIQTNGFGAEGERLSRSTSATPEPRPCLRYKGRRTASGRDMPDQFRVETVKAFVEGTIWPFAGILAAPRQMPIVQMNKLNLPVRQTAAVYRQPKERQKQRQGWLQGPILCIQVRSETEFLGPGMTEQQRETKSRLDTMRELGGLIQLAQERQRQGKIENCPGEGKWWTHKPRWGGGPGGEVEKPDIPELDILQMAEEMVSSQNRLRRPKRKTPAMLWKELKPSSKLWDSKTEYQAIGKDPESAHDEVFMVSSLNHHVSILKMTVHPAYVEYIKSETVPEPKSGDENWCRPKVQRTQWYDLLDIDQRTEAFRVLWGVMSYLTRETASDSDTEMSGKDAS